MTRAAIPHHIGRRALSIRPGSCWSMPMPIRPIWPAVGAGDGHRRPRRWCCCARRGLGSASGWSISRRRCAARTAPMRSIATGDTDYGPFSADVMVATGQDAERRDRQAAVRRRRTSTARVEQTAAGPFAGTLAFAGSGVDRHRAAGARRAACSAPMSPRTPINAKIPGKVGFHHRPRDHQRDARAVSRRAGRSSPTCRSPICVTGRPRSPRRAREDRLSRRQAARRSWSPTDRTACRSTSRANAQLVAEHLARRARRQWPTGVNFQHGEPGADREGRRRLSAGADADRVRSRARCGSPGSYGERHDGAGAARRARSGRSSTRSCPAWASAASATGSVDFTLPSGGGASRCAGADRHHQLHAGRASPTVSSPVDITLNGTLLPERRRRARARQARRTPRSGGWWRRCGRWRRATAGSTRLVHAPLSGRHPLQRAGGGAVLAVAASPTSS